MYNSFKIPRGFVKNQRPQGEVFVIIPAQIVGLGGGSSMDTAKAVGLRVTHPGELREYEGIVGGGGKIKPVLPPLVCIPTTSGTGSEVNPCAVITDRELDVSIRLKALGIPRDDLKKIAFYTSRDAVNMATDPTTPDQERILQLLEEIYE